MEGNNMSPNIKELYENWNKEPSHKMNPVMIQEYLTEKYPTAYYLPDKAAN